MAKKDGSSPKKSAAPYTPEVVPGNKPAKKAAKPAAKSRNATTDQNPPQMVQEMPTMAPPKTAAKPVMAEIKPAPVESTAMSSPPEIEAPAASIPSMENAISTPAVVSAGPKTITWEMINERAYFISISGYGGSQDDNWHRAESELKRELGL